MAEGIFQTLIEQNNLNWQCDSCGTASYHIGEKPDRRTLKVLEQQGIQTRHRARQLSTEDFDDFDYIVAMDHSNMRNIKAKAPGSHKAQLVMMGAFFEHSDGQVLEETPDPYYGHLSDFEALYELLEPACQNLMDHMRHEH